MLKPSPKSIYKICAVLPFLAFILSPIKAFSNIDVNTVSAFLYFILLFSSVSIAKFLLKQKLSAAKGTSKVKIFFDIILTILIGITTIASLQLLRININDIQFLIVLLLIPFSLLSDKMLEKNKLIPYYLLMLTYLTGISVLSISIWTKQIVWQSILFSLAIACLSLSGHIIHSIFPENRDSIKIHKKIRRILLLSLCLGPTIIGSMGVWRVIPYLFTFIIFTIALLQPTIASLKLKKNKVHLTLDTIKQSTAFILLSSALCLILGLL